MVSSVSARADKNRNIIRCCRLTPNNFTFLLRPSIQAKSSTVAKVTFAELPADCGQNKENDQPSALENEPTATEIEEKPAAPQPLQPQQQACNNAKNVTDSDDGEAKIIPWRAQLRKTNSTLNLLE